jgi:hypothetical protein
MKFWTLQFKPKVTLFTSLFKIRNNLVFCIIFIFKYHALMRTGVGERGYEEGPQHQKNYFNNEI